MRIAVVIPTLDEASRVQGAVHSARAAGVEVIVVDGGSRDATRELARAEGARVIQSEPGRARQLQAGAAASDAEAILFLHADTILPPDWSGAVRRALADPRTAGGAFRLRFAERGLALALVERAARLRARLARLPYGDQALFVRRRVLLALGGVPQVPVMEDLDLVRGMRRHGRLALLPEAVETSGRRHREGGVWRTALRHALALAGWRLGVDRARLATWLRR